MERACYRKLTSYKYQVMEDYIIQIDLKPLKQIRPKVAKFVSLSQNGLLTIKKLCLGRAQRTDHRYQGFHARLTDSRRTVSINAGRRP